MPKIFGTNLLGIIAAAIAFYIVGFLIYGILFSEQWMALNGITMEEATARNEAMGPMMYVWGLVISLIQAIGLAAVINYARAKRAPACVKVAAIVATLIALPVMLYAWLYGGMQIGAIGLDYVHILLGYVVMGAIIAAFRGKDAVVADS